MVSSNNKNIVIVKKSPYGGFLFFGLVGTASGKKLYYGKLNRLKDYGEYRGA